MIRPKWTHSAVPTWFLDCDHISLSGKPVRLCVEISRLPESIHIVAEERSHDKNGRESTRAISFTLDKNESDELIAYLTRLP